MLYLISETTEFKIPLKIKLLGERAEGIKKDKMVATK